nr:reverse transcriptase domain-containing protein [Tanacetum cinerariifolium]
MQFGSTALTGAGVEDEAGARAEDWFFLSKSNALTMSLSSATSDETAGEEEFTQSVYKTDVENYVKANDAVIRNMQNHGQNVQNQLTNLMDMVSKPLNSNIASSLGSGALPGNTITNSKEDLKGITTRSGVAYQGPTIPTPSE